MTNRGPASRWLPVLQTTLLRVTLVLAVFTVILAAHKSYFLRNATRTQGVVIQLEEIPVADSSGGLPGVLYSPVFQYRVGGALHTVHANHGANPAIFSTGESVEVLYMPANPDRAQLKAFTRRWGWAESFGIATLITGAAGLTMRWANGSRKSWEYIPAGQ